MAKNNTTDTNATTGAVATAAQTGTELAAQDGLSEQGGFANTEALSIIQESMDDLAGLEFGLDRIKLPAGGVTAFEVPGDEDETEMVKDITGVILYNHPAYAYYINPYTGGNNPPDCASVDGLNGTGNPGGNCKTCPFNQFGSGDGQGKACKNRRMLYIMREGELFPMMLNLPTGSLKEFTKYVKRQLTKGRRLSRIVTKIQLKKAKSATGIDFSQAVFSFVRMLNPAEVAAMEQMTEQVKGYAANLNISALVPDDEAPARSAGTGGAALDPALDDGFVNVEDDSEDGLPFN